MTEPQKFWPRLQTIFARGAPVIAIGPGCHRIDYESSEGWERVIERAGQVWRRLDEPGGRDGTGDQDKEEARARTRRLFFERFWIAYRCEEAPGQTGNGNGTGDGAPPTAEEIRNHERKGDFPDAARVVLAIELLCALVDATSLLGATVEKGAEPVADWQHVVADLGDDDAEMFPRAGRRLEKAMRLAQAVEEVHEQGAKAPLPEALAEHGLTKANVDSERLGLLKLEEIRAALGVLLETHFRTGAGSVSGAVVEWLSDLLWHVLSSGAGVPPSQAELSFYLNLHEIDYSSRRFSRAFPGEYRGPEEDNGKTLDRDVELLLDSYDSGLEEKERDWGKLRELFAWNMARSLVKVWREERQQEESQERFTIALVSDYDLMLERAMLEHLKEGEPLHVIAPARVKWDEQYKYRWLLGTIQGDDGGTLAEPKWEWFHKREKALASKLGPVVIRLTGTPLFSWSEEVEESLIEQRGSDNITEVWPTTVFSEHESVQAVMALTPSQQPGTQPEKRFREQLLFGTEGLTWSWRGWLFFGHRFSDWLPRLQLLITALMLAQDEHIEPTKLKRELKRKLDPFEKAPKHAVSRRFDWPERALLDALEIRRDEQDLANVADYFERKGGERLGPETEKFVGEMAKGQPGKE